MASLSSHVDSAYGGPNPRAKHTKSPLLVVRYVGAGSEFEGPIVNNDSVLRKLVAPSETKISPSAFASKGCPLAGRYVVLAITPNVVIAGATLLDEDAEEIVEDEDSMDEDDTAEDVMLDEALEVFDDVLLDELDCLADEEVTALDELDDLADEDGRLLDELWLLFAEPVLEALALAEEELVMADLHVVNRPVEDDCSRLFEEEDDAENTDNLGALDAADDE